MKILLDYAKSLMLVGSFNFPCWQVSKLISCSMMPTYLCFKCQLISKRLFSVFNSSKRRTKTIRLEVPSFGRIEDMYQKDISKLTDLQCQHFLMSKSNESQKNIYPKIYSLLIHVRKAKHQRRSCDGYFPNSLRPISYLGYTVKLGDKERLKVS